MPANPTLVEMPTRLSIMDMPHEILLMILTFYFSNTAIQVRRLERPTRRSGFTNANQQLPACMALLLVNKVMSRLGRPCQYENTTVWSDAIFAGEKPLVMSWAYQKMPWRAYKHIAGSRWFSYRFEHAARRGMLPVHHLREIDLHYT